MLDIIKRHTVETKVTFQKCRSISRTHCFLFYQNKSFELQAVKPVLVNDCTVTRADAVIRLKNLDRIQFPCNSCSVPHLYHVIIEGESPSEEANQHNFNGVLFQPLLSRLPKSSHKLRAFIQMMTPKVAEPIQKHAAWTREKKRQLKRFLLAFGYGRWNKISRESRSRCSTFDKGHEAELRPYANIFLLGLA